MPETNGTSVKLPMILLISAITAALLGLGSWALALERSKADRSEVATMQELIVREMGRINMRLDSLINLQLRQK